MSSIEIQRSLELLKKDWEIDPLIQDFILGKTSEVSDYTVKIKDVVFHIPYLTKEKKYILWKCYWPDCHNCCNRQGRLPLTSDDLIQIGTGLKYQKISDFIKNETLIATHEEPTPSGGLSIMTNVNLKRKEDETEADDGTHITCRFLDAEGACGIHPGRPGVCYLYPFSTWAQNDKGRARVHATFQFTGDCPGFYLDESLDSMKEILEEYSSTIYDYNMKSSTTLKVGFGSLSMN